MPQYPFSQADLDLLRKKGVEDPMTAQDESFQNFTGGSPQKDELLNNVLQAKAPDELNILNLLSKFGSPENASKLPSASQPDAPLTGAMAGGTVAGAPMPAQPQPQMSSMRKASRGIANAQVPQEPSIPAPAPLSPIGLGSVDFGQNDLASQERLQAAQSAKNESNLLSMLGKSADMIGQGISGARYENPVWDAIAKNADQSVQDYAQQIAFQKEDPNSTYSKGFKDYLKQMGLDIKGDITASQAEKLMPEVFRHYESQLAQNVQRELGAQKLAAQAQESQLNRESKENIAKMGADIRRDVADMIGAQKQEAAEKKSDEKKSHNQNTFIERTSKQLEKHTESLQKVRRANVLLDEAVKNPSAIKDVSALYQLITALDPDSVVREGEINLANKASGLFGNLTLKLSQMTTDPRLITSKNLKEMQKTVKQLREIADSEYDARRQAAYKRAKSQGIEEERFSEFDPYAQDGRQPASSDEMIRVRDKKTGKEKTLAAETAKKYLSDPNFEKVQ